MFENIVSKQQMIHMAAEVIILIGVIFYFSQKNRKISNQIEDLIQRVEEQEDIIQKHEELIQKMAKFLNTMSSQQTSVSRPIVQAVPRKVSKPKPNPQPQDVPITFDTQETNQPVVQELFVQEPVTENKNELDENLDEELEEELLELNNEEALKNNAVSHS